MRSSIVATVLVVRGAGRRYAAAVRARGTLPGRGEGRSILEAARAAVAAWRAANGRAT